MKTPTVMIATLYSYEPVIAGVLKLGADKLILLVDQNPDETQEIAIKKVKDAVSDVVSIELVPTTTYDLLEITKKCVNILEGIKGKAILNVSAARKTKALGLLYAGYARPNKVSRIVYITKESKDIVTLPTMTFNLTKSQESLLRHLKEKGHSSRAYIDLRVSRSMYYKTIGQLRERGFLDEENTLTTAGIMAII